jgi:hypothetical protein
VYAKLSRHCDGAAEEEKGVEDVKGKRDWCAGHDASECARYEEDE